MLCPCALVQGVVLVLCDSPKDTLVLDGLAQVAALRLVAVVVCNKHLQAFVLPCRDLNQPCIRPDP